MMDSRAIERMVEENAERVRSMIPPFDRAERTAAVYAAAQYMCCHPVRSEDIPVIFDVAAWVLEHP